LIIDVSLLMLDILLESIFGHSHKPEAVEIIESIIYVLTLTILVIFLFGNFHSKKQKCLF
jgi:hypothetical protein